MKSKVVIIGFALLLCISGYSFAEKKKGSASSEESKVTKGESKEETQEALKFCPVCGPEEEMHGLAFSYKHKGKKHLFCSMGCLKAFKKNPEQFIEDSNEEKTEQSIEENSEE